MAARKKRARPTDPEEVAWPRCGVRFSAEIYCILRLDHDGRHYWCARDFSKKLEWETPRKPP